MWCWPSLGRSTMARRHLVVAEAHVAQQVVDEQLEPVAVLAVAVERLAERGPVVDRAVGPVVAARLALDPGRRLRGDLALLLAAEGEVLGAQVAIVAARRRRRCARARRPRPARWPSASVSPIARSRACQPRIFPLHGSPGRGRREEAVAHPARRRSGTRSPPAAASATARRAPRRMRFRPHAGLNRPDGSPAQVERESRAAASLAGALGALGRDAREELTSENRITT